MIRRFYCVLIIFLIILSLASAAGAQTYKPTKASLRSHPAPQWYNDAKLGIFIHWGLFSVPAYAPVDEWLKWKEKREGGMPHNLRLKHILGFPLKNNFGPFFHPPFR